MLPQYTSIGSYTIVYLNAKNEPLCAKCATKAGLTEENGELFMEGEPTVCDECAVEIESSYGPVEK